VAHVYNPSNLGGWEWEVHGQTGQIVFEIPSSK
jgi:hypothetical protein